MPPIDGAPRKYRQKWKYKVEIEGLTVGWFESCSSLEGETGVAEAHEAGDVFVSNQSPGKVKYQPVTLSIGATTNNELFEWWQQIVDVGSGLGDVDNKYKKTVNIIELDRDDTELRTHKLSKAWPNKFTFGEYDSKAEENVMESITLVVRTIDRENAA